MNEATYRLVLAALRSIANDIDPAMRKHARAVLHDLAAVASGFADDIDGHDLRELINARDTAVASMLPSVKPPATESALVEFVDGVLALWKAHSETKHLHRVVARVDKWCETIGTELGCGHDLDSIGKAIACLQGDLAYYQDAEIIK